MDKGISKKNIIFLFLFIILMLQSLRNINSLVYTGILLSAYILFAFTIINNKIKLTTLEGVFYFLYFIFPIISLVQMSIDEFIKASIRYCAVAIFVFLTMFCKDEIRKKTLDIIRIFIIIVVAAGLLIIYQVFFGTIDFLAATEVVERLGYRRFGSLLGSATSFGTFAPLAIILLYDYPLSFKNFTRKLFEVIIIVAGMLCLSKAFFVNLAIAYFFSYILRFHKKKFILTWKRIILFVFITVSIILALYFILTRTVVGDYFTKMLNYTLSSESTGVKADLINRITEYPIKVFKYFKLSFWQYIFGVGFRGYSGVLGLSNYPMCHNNYFDIILSQGIVFFIIIMSLYIRIFIDAFRIKDEHSNFKIHLIMYILINMTAGQWSYLHIYSMIFLAIVTSNITNFKKQLHN